jgi:alpha-galactosidase
VNKVNREFLTRREFIRLGTGVAALSGLTPEAGASSLLAPGDTYSAMPQSTTSRRWVVETEMQAADDFLRSFQNPTSVQNAASGWKRRASTTLFQETMTPPFSFRFGRHHSTELLPRCQLEVKTSELDAQRQQHEITYVEPETKVAIRVSATRYRDFPGVEWVVHFKNNGASDAPLLDDVQALDTEWRSPSGDPTIHYAKGATCSMDDFMPIARQLNAKGEVRLEPGGGRSSSDFLPFFNFEAKGEGAVVAVGWTGEWAASFSHPAGSDIRVRAGMALTHLKLLPGEEIRTPRILTLFWQGDRMRGHNMLRQFLLTHHRPMAGGKPVTVPICIGNWGGTSAALHLENLRQIAAHQLPTDYYWIDAEWFGKGNWWTTTGNWEYKRDLYPQGLKPISNLAHASGLKFLLWFEPERVCERTPWYTEHAKWLLEVPKDKRVYNWGESQADPVWVRHESLRNQITENDRLFNLGIPEARQFLTEFISRKIDEFGIDCFRHDANIAPLEFWRAADAPERQGITEIRWVEGLYAFWDELRRQHPNLLIDVCASGGRRIDLETVGRCVPLTRTDFVRSDTANQCHTYGLLHWAPLNSTVGPSAGPADVYGTRSGMSSGLEYSLFGNGDAAQTRHGYDDIPFDLVKKSLEQQRAMERFFYGDYYPLTEYSQSGDTWMAYQLDLPDEHSGLLVVLKRASSAYTRAAFQLKALDEDAQYALANLDTGQKTTLSGSELMRKGFELTLARRPDSALFQYSAISPS